VIQRLDHGLSQLAPGRCLYITRKEWSHGFAFPRRAGWQQKIGKSGGGIFEEVDVDVEVQGFQRLYAALRITMPNEQINAEQHHRSDRIRTFIDDGVVDRSRLDVPRVVRWTERMIRDPKPLLTLLRR